MNYDTIKFFNLEDFDHAIEEASIREDFDHAIEEASIRKINNKISCFVILKKRYDPCPDCNSNNSVVHGYYEKHITHSTLTGSPCFIVYKAHAALYHI